MKTSDSSQPGSIPACHSPVLQNGGNEGTSFLRLKGHNTSKVLRTDCFLFQGTLSLGFLAYRMETTEPNLVRSLGINRKLLKKCLAALPDK